MKISNEDIHKCRTDLLFYVTQLFKLEKNTEFDINWHHAVLAQALEKVVGGKIKRLILNLPPRYSKTELAVVGFITWCFGNIENSKFLHTSYTLDLANNNSANIKAVMESEFYNIIFPDCKISTGTIDSWKTSNGGHLKCSGSQGSVTGFGAGGRDMFRGCIIIDDPHKVADIYSPAERDKVKKFYENSISTRMNSKHSAIIIIMQRLHQDDLTGYLLKRDNGVLAKTKEKWEHIVIPGIDKQGEALWPEMHDLEDYEEMKIKTPYLFHAQYLQNPLPEGGGIFKDKWWKFYMDEPKFEYRIITGDTAYKTKTSNDYSVFQCWGYNKELKSAFLIDQIRGKWEIPNLREILLRFYLKHVKIKNGKLRCCYIEEKASGAYLIQDLKKKHGIPIKRAEKTNTSNVDKVTRAHNEVDNVSCGYVYLPGRNLKDLKYGWVSEFISEFSSFTSNGTHTYDDQIDAALYALNILLRHKAAVKVTRNRVFSF